MSHYTRGGDTRKGTESKLWGEKRLWLGKCYRKAVTPQAETRRNEVEKRNKPPVL